MITDGSYRLIGLKHSDITAELDNLINSASEFLIIGGYSFTKPSNYKSILKKIINSPVSVKHCIFPIDLYGGKDTNRPYAIELINQGVSVSIESVNHSKWLMNENEIYFGSANFTNFSIEKRIEVVTFKTFNGRDILKKEFIDFVLSSMRKMSNKSTRAKITGVISRNQRLISTHRRSIKVFNPSIKKVKSTLESISKVQSAINELLVNSYWYLDNKSYYRLTREASNFSRVLSKINSLGNNIVYQYENQFDYQRTRKYYNEACQHFLNKSDNLYLLANDFIKSEEIIPEFTYQNRDLLKHNSKVISKQKLLIK